MKKKYSITEARRNLTAILRGLVDGQAVEITRQGKSIAVLISTTEYDRLKSHCRNVWRVDRTKLNMDPDKVFGALRDKTPGRKVEF